MQKYNEASFALIGVLEQINNTVKSFSAGWVGVNDLQQKMADMVDAVVQFSSTDEMYSGLLEQAQAFTANYADAASLTTAQLQDFQSLVYSIYTSAEHDYMVASSAGQTYVDIVSNLSDESWNTLFANLSSEASVDSEEAAVVENADVVTETAVEENGEDTGETTFVATECAVEVDQDEEVISTEFFNILVTDDYVQIAMDPETVVNGDYASAFEYSVYLENTDGSEMYAGEMYVYVEYCGTYDPAGHIDSAQPSVIYDYTYDYALV
ncbi:MAG: hypothetical protein JSS50_04840 [Proteobacteria bacterium]|nr:hypothetical protein [Pseudomonadota bacterium]